MRRPLAPSIFVGVESFEDERDVIDVWEPSLITVVPLTPLALVRVVPFCCLLLLFFYEPLSVGNAIFGEVGSPENHGSSMA